MNKAASQYHVTFLYVNLNRSKEANVLQEHHAQQLNTSFICGSEPNWSKVKNGTWISDDGEKTAENGEKGQPRAYKIVTRKTSKAAQLTETRDRSSKHSNGPFSPTQADRVDTGSSCS